MFFVAAIPLLMQMLWIARIGSKKAIFMIVPLPTKELIFLKDLIEAEKEKSGVIT